PQPLHTASLRIPGVEIAAHVHRVAADAHDDVVLHDQRRRGGEVLALLVGDLLPPSLLAVLRVQRDEPAVGTEEIEPISVHRHAALTDEMAAAIVPVVLPDLFAG